MEFKIIQKNFIVFVRKKEKVRDSNPSSNKFILDTNKSIKLNPKKEIIPLIVKNNQTNLVDLFTISSIGISLQILAGQILPSKSFCGGRFGNGHFLLKEK